MAARVPARLTPAEGRRFAFPVGAAFVVLGAVLVWRGRIPAGAVVAGMGGTLLVAGLAIPERLGPVERGWMRFARALSRVTTPILMTVVFVLVITPVGFAMRMAGHRPLARRSGSDSFWAAQHSAAKRSDLERQF
ncbi:MAG: SxtJ family membrane protein [Gemmatimonadales bacterium]